MRRSRSRTYRRAAAALLAFSIAACRPAEALDDFEQCFYDKMTASRVVSAGYIACGFRHPAGDAKRLRCQSRLEQRADRLLARADARVASQGFHCPGDSASLALSGASIWPFRFVEDGLPAADSICADPPAKATRRFASGYARCVQEVWLSKSGSMDECSDPLRDRFRRAWDAIPGAAPCPDDEVDKVVRRIEDEIGETASRLEVRCGDGIVGGFEECDDAGTAANDGCSAECQKEECRRVGEDVRCMVCPSDSVPNDEVDGCVCPSGYEGQPGSCVDIDECAVDEDPCGDGRPCVNLEGTWACAIDCTADAFHQAIANCGAPSNSIAFNCSDTVIEIPSGIPGRPRDLHCDGVTVDGRNQGIVFQLDPLCWQTPVGEEDCPPGRNEDGTCDCPDLDSGDPFLALRGNNNVVRGLMVRGFFDGIPVRGRNNTVEDVLFERLCDDAFGSVSTGVGNVFRDLHVRLGCDKCSENGGLIESADTDPRLREYYHSLISDVEFESCRTPVRVSSSARMLLERIHAYVSDPEFPCDGPRFSASNDETSVEIRMRESRIENCRRGVRLGRGVGAVISDTEIRGCGLRGVRAAVSARASIEGSTIVGNGGQGSGENGFGGVAAVGGGRIDLGGGTLEIGGQEVYSAGGNSICSNLNPNGTPREVENDSDSPAEAVGNWWCSTQSPADRLLGLVDVEPRLTRAPLPRRLSW